MKKRGILAGAILAGVLMAGCGNGGAQGIRMENKAAVQNEETAQNDVSAIVKRIQDSYDICAIIREIGDGKVVLDTVEFITLADTERMAELGLTEADFPNGYYIYNADENTDEYLLAEGAEFHFIDWDRNFVEEGAEDIKISTEDRALFEEYIAPYMEAGSKVPFFFRLDGDEVCSITEEALTSM